MNAVFFPRNDYPNNVEVCAHRLGKKMTFTDQTDGLHTELSYTPYMAMAKARNIKVGCFVDLMNPVSSTVVKEDYDNGEIWLDAYSLTPNLEDYILPNRPHSGEQITQALWNVAYNTYIYPYFFGFTGKKPVALSYSYGVQNFKDYVSQFLGARNSAYNGDTDYGIGNGTPDDKPYSFSRYCSKAGTMRWYDQAKENDNDFQGQLSIVSAKIDETLLNGGWLNNFTHWHNYYSDGNGQWAETYLDLLASKNANNEICFSGYGEAIAYLVFRQMITKAVMYSPNAHPNTQLVIRLETDNTLSIDTDLLQVPISIKFSTVSTPLENHNIKCDARNLISLGNNEYIIEIPFSRFPTAILEKVSI